MNIIENLKNNEKTHASHNLEVQIQLIENLQTENTIISTVTMSLGRHYQKPFPIKISKTHARHPF